MYATPGLLTDTQSPVDPHGQPADLAALVEHGWEWLSFQAYNPHNPDGVAVRDFDLGPAKAARFKSVGVWGVTYGKDDMPDAAVFKRDGTALARQAVKLGAQHVLVDAEMCAKFTRDTRGMQPFIDGVRLGGWKGPVHLCPLGAPVNPRTAANPGGNDFGVDAESFLATGGGVFHQDYVNEAQEYRPDLCVAYWAACGVAVERQNVMIALYGGALGRLSGAEWVPLLQAAGVKRNLSVFMVQHGDDFDWEALEPFTRVVSPNQARLGVIEQADRWLNQQQGAQRLSRLRTARRIASPDNDDSKWNSVREQIAALLDNAGVAL